MLQRAVLAVGRVAAAPATARAAGARCASEWLQGKPPTVNLDAGTMAAFYYKNIRQAAIPTRDHIVAPAQDQKFTLGQFDTQVYAYAVGLLEGLGLKKGHKVGTWMSGELEHVVINYAAGLLGIEVVAIDPAVGFDGVLKVIADEGLRTLIMSPRFGSEDRAGKLHDVFGPELAPTAATPGYVPFESKRFRSLKHVVCTSTEFFDGIVRMRDLPVVGDNGSYEGDDVAAVQAYVSKGDTAVTYYSAGAAAGAAGGAGAAAIKAGSKTYAELLSAAAGASKAAGLTSKDVVVSTAPLHTAAGFAGGVLAAASAGAKSVFPGRAFDAAETLEAATAQGATALVATPEQVTALQAALAADAAGKKAYSVAALRTGLVVGGSAPVTLGGATLKPLA